MFKNMKSVTFLLIAMPHVKMSQLNATEAKKVNVIISINKLCERLAICSAASEISSLGKLVPLLWLLAFDEFKQK